MDLTDQNLSNFMELPDRDIFAKTRPFTEFMDALKKAEFFHWQDRKSVV